MTFRLTFNTFLFLLISIGSFAQSITGKAHGQEGQAIPFANVLLFNSIDTSLVTTAITDTSGNFEMDIPSDTLVHYITIQSMGFTDFTSEEFVGEKDFDNIKMNTNSVELGAVNIFAAKPLIEKTGRGLVMNIASSPIMQNSTAKGVLEKIPGAQVNIDGSISLKGKQNVKIFMDGKPTNMSIDDLMKLLENMPANEIEKVEVFEIPPAKYDASGTAGVINIVTKKGARLGFNGSIAARGGYGNMHKASTYSNVNYRNKKFNAFGSGWYYNVMNDHVGTQNMIMEAEGGTSSFFNRQHRNHHTIGVGSRAGIDYFINDKTTLGYIGVYYNGGTKGWEPSTVDVTGPASSNYDFIDANNNFQYFWSGHTHNLNLKSQLKKNEAINIDLDFAKRLGGNDNSNLNNYFKNDSVLTPYYIQQQGITTTTFGMAKLDYENTIFKDYVLETGAKGSWIQTNNDFESFNGTGTEDIEENLNASNTFKYEEIIVAGYGAVAKKWGKKWSADVGLRLEYTAAIGISPTTSINFENNYINLFPNTSVAYAVAKKYSFSGAYTRRIDRPKYHQLNPFQTQTNQFNFHQGNPKLQPQMSNVATFTYGLRETFYFTLSGSHMKGLMNQVIKQEEDLERQVHITENLDKFENYSFNAFVPFKIKKWYSGNLNSTVFYNKMSSDVEWGVVGYEIFTFSLQSQHIFSLPKGYKIELSGYYNHDSYWNIWFVEPHYQIDLGATKSIGKFKFNLMIRDFLNIREGNGGVFQGNINMATTYKPESRKVNLSITYRFGNNKVKASRQRKTGSEDLQNRSSK
jgi:hypothetical protein